jgi:hypothetical protein
MMVIFECLEGKVTPGEYIQCFNAIPLINVWALLYLILITLSVIKLYSLLSLSLGKSLLITGFVGSMAGLGLFIAELLNPYYISVALAFMAIGVILSIAKT